MKIIDRETETRDRETENRQRDRYKRWRGDKQRPRSEIGKIKNLPEMNCKKEKKLKTNTKDGEKRE